MANEAERGGPTQPPRQELRAQTPCGGDPLPDPVENDPPKGPRPRLGSQVKGSVTSRVLRRLALAGLGPGPASSRRLTLSGCVPALGPVPSPLRASVSPSAKWVRQERSPPRLAAHSGSSRSF